MRKYCKTPSPVRWTDRTDGEGVWAVGEFAGNLADCGGKQCGKRKCKGHYGFPYPVRCPICKRRKHIEVHGLPFKEGGDVYVCCNEYGGCANVLTTYVLKGQVTDWSKDIADYSKAVEQLIGTDESKTLTRYTK